MFTASAVWDDMTGLVLDHFINFLIFNFESVSCAELYILLSRHLGNTSFGFNLAIRREFLLAETLVYCGVLPSTKLLVHLVRSVVLWACGAMFLDLG